MGAIHQAERTLWIDCCKGLCIILVVYGHVSGGLGAGGILAPNSVWLALRNWIYLFHMPAFFALSGILASKSRPLSTIEFLTGRLRTVVYPYVIWTAVYLASQIAMARFVNNPADLHHAFYFMLEPYGYGLWFLYALFLISLFYYFLRRWQIPAGFILALGFGLSFLASRYFFNVWQIFNQAMGYFIFYAAGACAEEAKLLRFPARQRLMAILGGLSLWSIMTILFCVGWTGNWLAGQLLTWLGIAGVICLANGLVESIGSRILILLGFYSLEIYLGHPLWGTVARVALPKSGIHSPTVVLFGAVLLGISVSLLIGVLCRAWKFPYLFRWPSKSRILNVEGALQNG